MEQNDRHMSKQNGTGRFESLGLKPELVAAVARLGFERPTAIQSAAIPAALEGRHVLACAMTGSGKTAAFLLPIVDRLMDQERGVTRALVLTPTRELAEQVTQHLADLTGRVNVNGAAVYGGVGMRPQETAFRRGVDVIVATPGRLLDHFQYPYARLNDIDVLVLDEADRMLDMGFLPAIRQVLGHLPRRPRQTMLFSATIPAPIVELSRQLQDRPVAIDIGRASAPPKGVTQAIYPVPANLKVELLLELLRRREVGNAIVFCRTKHRANRLAEKLEKQGVSVARIHGGRKQSQRSIALEGFKRGHFQILVATDIVARGIDVEALEHVINFDVPASPDDYIHRVGRTARAEATGEAYTFVARDEEGAVRGLERAAGRKIERRVVKGFDYNARSDERLEIPLEERLAAWRARRADDRARAAARAERAGVTRTSTRPQARHAKPGTPAMTAGREGTKPRRPRRTKTGVGGRRGAPRTRK
ncbi:MAG: DEAD/DEAH box helicase [Longimicrobiales bacterium]